MIVDNVLQMHCDRIRSYYLSYYVSVITDINFLTLFSLFQQHIYFYPALVKNVPPHTTSQEIVDFFREMNCHVHSAALLPQNCGLSGTGK